jgi:hypothetical protein
VCARCVADVEVVIIGNSSETPCEVCDSGDPEAGFECVDCAVGDGPVALGEPVDEGGEGPWPDADEADIFALLSSLVLRVICASCSELRW